MQARYETGRSFFYCRSGSDLQRCDGVRTREYACMTRLDWSAIVVFSIDCPFDHKVLKPGEVIKIGRDECVCRPPLQCSAVKKEKKDEEEKPTEPRIEGINEEKCAVGGAFFFQIRVHHLRVKTGAPAFQNDDGANFAAIVPFLTLESFAKIAVIEPSSSYKTDYINFISSVFRNLVC